MNIHFTDPILFENLKEATLAKVKVGSYLYGTNNENSDEDFLYIYATSQPELNSFISTHHQLQYKENNVDHNFVSFHTFLKNAINGDSPINFEVIQSNELLGTPLAFLQHYSQHFLTYTIIRSYNGLVKRDIKHYNKAQTDYDKKKRLGHIIRGILYTELMLQKNFEFHYANQIFIDHYRHSSVNLDPRFINEDLQRLQQAAEEQRKLLNAKLDAGTLGYAKNFDVNQGTLLNTEIQRLIMSAEWLDRQNKIANFDMSYFIEAFENWVTY